MQPVLQQEAPFKSFCQFSLITSRLRFIQFLECSLMDKFGWKRISSIHDNSGVFFLTTADDFVSKVNANSTLELVTRIPTSLSYISDAFANLRDAGARIVYASLTIPEAANLMCEAYKGGFLWPGYVYIFHERTFQELNESETACDEGEMTDALEGIFLLQYRLHAEPNDTLVSASTRRSSCAATARRPSRSARAGGRSRPSAPAPAPSWKPCSTARCICSSTSRCEATGRKTPSATASWASNTMSERISSRRSRDGRREAGAAAARMNRGGTT